MKTKLVNESDDCRRRVEAFETEAAQGSAIRAEQAYNSAINSLRTLGESYQDALTQWATRIVRAFTWELERTREHENLAATALFFMFEQDCPDCGSGPHSLTTALPDGRFMVVDLSGRVVRTARPEEIPDAARGSLPMRPRRPRGRRWRGR